MVNQYSSEDSKAIKIQVHPRPCLWQGTAENRWVNHYSSEDSKAIKIPRPPSALSLAGDSREPMVNQYSSEDSMATRGQPRTDGKPIFFGG